MGKDLEIIECIRRMAGKPGNVFTICKVSNIDENKYTCDGDPVDGSAKITGIRLRSVTENHQSTVVIPADNSLVLVAMLSNVDAYVLHADEAKKILVKVGNSTIEITDGVVNINGGDNKGIVKVDSMVSWMQKVYSDLSTLQGLLSASVVAGNGAPLGIVFTPQTSAPASADFENSKVKH